MKLNPVPKKIRCEIEKGFEVQEKIEKFLLKTQNYLEEKYGKSPSFEIKSDELGNSDNRLTYLLYNDCCVAGVFERRTEFNHKEYVFFRDRL